jgi:hypothetical protein
MGKVALDILVVDILVEKDNKAADIPQSEH